MCRVRARCSVRSQDRVSQAVSICDKWDLWQSLMQNTERAAGKEKPHRLSSWEGDNPLSSFQVTSSAERVCLCRAQHHKTYLCLREVFLSGSSCGAAVLRTWGIPRVQPYFHSAHSSDSAPCFPTSCWAVRHGGRADEQEQERSSHSSLHKKSGRSSYKKSLLPKMKRG